MADVSGLTINWATLQVAAETIYGEARGEPEAGKLAVAWVILNRARNPGWWGHDVYSVCLKERQFSCWNHDDPNREALLRATIDEPAMQACIRAFLDALSGAAPDPTGGSDHYCVASLTPSWAQTDLPEAIIGNHKFYRLALQAGR